MSGHKRRELEGLTCRCSMNVFIFSFEVFFVISEEDKSCHFDHLLLPPQSFPVPPSMVTPGPSAELSPSPLPTGGNGTEGASPAPGPAHGLLGLLEPLLSAGWACAGGRAGSTFSGGTCMKQEPRDTAPPHCALFSLPTPPLPRGGGGRGMGWSQGEGAVAGHPLWAGQQA